MAVTPHRTHRALPGARVTPDFFDRLQAARAQTARDLVRLEATEQMLMGQHERVAHSSTRGREISAFIAAHRVPR